MQFGIWSADYTQITGQALVTARVVRQQRAVWREYLYRGRGWRSVLTWTQAVACLWRDIVLGRVRSLYLVCSRSNGGFLRDIPALLSAMVGVRVVVHAHGSDIVDLLSSRWLSRLARGLYAGCEVVVPSTHILEPLRKVTVAPLHLCENYFAGGYSNVINALPAPGVLTVLWNSNVMASKGFFDLTKAIRRVRTDGIPARLVSIGQPLSDEEMISQNVSYRLQALLAHEWLDHHGKVDPATAVALAEQADVVCLPSRYRSECQPLAIIHAMCTGKAIVVSDIPALRATVGDYPACFVPVRSVDAIANALRILHDQKQADPVAFASSRKEAAAAARKRFSAERFDREMAAILRLDVAAE